MSYKIIALKHLLNECFMRDIFLSHIKTAGSTDALENFWFNKWFTNTDVLQHIYNTDRSVVTSLIIHNITHDYRIGPVPESSNIFKMKAWVFSVIGCYARKIVIFNDQSVSCEHRMCKGYSTLSNLDHVWKKMCKTA